MKYTFRINQAGVVQQGLLGAVDVCVLCLLDYLAGWFFCDKATRVTVAGREFRWLDYAHAVGELPLLFNPNASVRTGKNALCRMMDRLRQAGLVETAPVGRRLFFRLTDKAAALSSHRGEIITKSRTTVTPRQDETITPNHEDSIMRGGDGSGPLHIDETDIKEENIKEEGIKEHKHPLALRSEKCVPSASDSSSSPSLDEQAATIYAAYPRQVARKPALSAIRRALRTMPFEQLLECTTQFGRAWAGAAPEELRYCPYPTTWFKQERFNEPPESWQKPGSASRPSATSPTKFVSPDQFTCSVGKL